MMLMRVRNQYIRILEGWEHMAMVGWDRKKRFCPGRPTISHEGLVSVAGNAFSGFAVFPVLVAGLGQSATAKLTGRRAAMRSTRSVAITRLGSGYMCHAHLCLDAYM